MIPASYSASQTTATSNASSVNVGSSNDLATLLFLANGGAPTNGGYSSGSIYTGISRQPATSPIVPIVLGAAALLTMFFLFRSK